MSRILLIVCAALFVSFTTLALAADAGGAATKTGSIQSVDAKALTITLNLAPNRPLTFKVTDKTQITLDGKASTFEAAMKQHLKATVTYTRSGDERIATRVDVTTATEKKEKPAGAAAHAADAPAGQAKTGAIASVDAKAGTFVLTLPARPLTFKVDSKTVITLDGKASTFEAAIKPELKATVTYSKVGEDRLASKVDVTR